MATLKCKYCGGNVSAFPDNALGTCTRCGATMTLPVGADNHRAAAHNCGNYLRRTGKFDQALAVYRKLLEEDPSDAESYWCSALCRFGVLYALDGESEEYQPQVNRPEAGSFLESGEYLAALAHSGGAVQLQYEKEAARIAARLGQRADSEEKENTAPEQLLKQGFWHLEKGQWDDAEGCLEKVLQAEPNHAMAHLGLLLCAFRCPNPKALAASDREIEKEAHYQAALEFGDESLQNFLRSCARQTRRRSGLERIEQAYRDASAAMEAASNEEEYRLASRQFAKLKGYKDAETQAKECLRRADILWREGVYRAALNAKNAGQAAQAAAQFARIPGWRDANAQAVECRRRAEAQEAAKPKKDMGISMVKKIAVSLFVLALLCLGGYLAVTRYVIPQQKYNAAQVLLEAGRREEAIEAFRALGTFKDSPDRVLGIQVDWYNQAEQLLAAGDPLRAAAAFGGLKDFQDARERSRALWETIVPAQTITAGGWFTAALRSDKTAVAIGDDREKQCWVSSWLNIRSISAGWEHTLGLRTDGTVVASGYNGDGRGEVDGWRDMAAISAGQWHTVGLKTNGRVIGIGCDKDGRLDFEDWQDIIGISAGRNHTVGLKADGTALAVGLDDKGQCQVALWNQLTAVSAGGAHTLGLKRDGRVVAAGDNEDRQCDVGTWQDITAVAAGYYHSVGLKADGTVVATGFNDYGQCDVSEWTDIVAVAAGGWHTLGLKADGSIVAAGRNENGQCETQGWDNMQIP